VSSLPSLALLLIFVASAAVIWGAGVTLSGYTDVLAERLHLGAALGGVVLLAVATNLDHVGRRSGLVRHTVLEVIAYDDATSEAFVISGFGVHADWFLNIQDNSRLRVHIGGSSFDAQHRMIPLSEAATLLGEYQNRHQIVAPLVRRVLTRLLGWDYDGSAAANTRAAGQLPMVAFRPASPAR
jgi:deazaflavin-dependent oxidoreductase (nitroreductase family)